MQSFELTILVKIWFELQFFLVMYVNVVDLQRNGYI